jgi:hypothetical protein
MEVDLTIQLLFLDTMLFFPPCSMLGGLLFTPRSHVTLLSFPLSLIAATVSTST